MYWFSSQLSAIYVWYTCCLCLVLRWYVQYYLILPFFLSSYFTAYFVYLTDHVTLTAIHKVSYLLLPRYVFACFPGKYHKSISISKLITNLILYQRLFICWQTWFTFLYTWLSLSSSHVPVSSVITYDSSQYVIHSWFYCLFICILAQQVNAYLQHEYNRKYVSESFSREWYVSHLNPP